MEWDDILCTHHRKIMLMCPCVLAKIFVYASFHRRVHGYLLLIQNDITHVHASVVLIMCLFRNMSIIAMRHEFRLTVGDMRLANVQSLPLILAITYVGSSH